MVKIRLNGTEKECSQAIEQIRSSFKVLAESKTYKDRGKNEYVRIYLDVENKRDGD